MKKIINILLIAILSIIFIGLALFVVNFAKESFNHNENKEDQNITHQSTKKDKKENKTNKDENSNSQEMNNSESNISSDDESANNNTTQQDNSQNNNTQENTMQNNNNNEQNNAQTNNTSENNTTQQTEGQEEPPGKNNFNQDAVNRSLDEAAQNPEQFDEDGDGKIEDSERTVTTDLLESQGRLKIYGEEDSEEEQ